MVVVATGADERGVAVNGTTQRWRKEGLGVRFFFRLFLLLASLIPQLARSQETMDFDCGHLHSFGQYGPYDYRVATRFQKELVESHHFYVEYPAFLRGDDYVETTEAGHVPVGGGFDYTLRAFPNHYRALDAMGKLSFRQKREVPFGATFRAQCYFERAQAFVPDDPMVHALYGVFLAERGRQDDSKKALVQLLMAAKPGASDANVMIEVANGYLHLKMYPDAEKYAKKAYALGYPLYGLRDHLRKLGYWTGP